jgi:gliding motility-associated protein GldM
MAGYKETPRQKMIGMMYLVLTALLALNVSKEILEAFVVVNESIESTNEKFAQKVDKMYYDFERQFEMNPAKVGPFWEKAKEVREVSNNMAKYIDSLRFEVIVFTQKNISLEEAKLTPMREIKKKDNFDAPTNFFVGTDTRKGIAYDLMDSINVHRTRMLKFVDEGRRESFDNRMGLRTDGKYHDAQGKELDWIRGNFYHTILAASVTILNKIKSEVYNAESDVISYLYSSFTEEDFKFSGLSAKVIPNSNFVFMGDQYRAEILIAAVDETQNPIVYYKEGVDTLRQEDIASATRVDGVRGSAFVSLPAGGEGRRKFAGIIEMIDPTGEKKYYNFKQDYMVARPSASISASKMNVFYRGVDNPVTLAAAGKAASELDVRVSAGRISRTDTGWVVKDIPPESFETTISIYADGKFMGSQAFRIRSLPNPIARVIGADDGKISVRRMMTNPFLLCTLPEWVEFQYDFRVTSFTMAVPRGGGEVLVERSESQMFTERMKNIIQSLRTNDVVLFRDINVRGPEGPRRIEAINITIN